MLTGLIAPTFPKRIVGDDLDAALNDPITDLLHDLPAEHTLLPASEIVAFFKERSTCQKSS